MTILIGVLFILPLLGAQLGMNLNVVWQFINRSSNIVIDAILRSTAYALSLVSTQPTKGIVTAIP
jgi:hypothetical protein